MSIACWLGKHRWAEQPYPSRFGDKSWRFSEMPYLIDDPLVWHMVYEECSCCDSFRWQLPGADAIRYWTGIDILGKR